jgi:dTDP-4-dehydrorhamnose 3,5-epimerase
MKFQELRLPGAYLVQLEPKEDERGFFARCFCEDEFAAHGLPVRFPQANLSRNRRAGTLRGMHFEAPSGNESKLVRCVRGAIHDVIVDLRPGAPTYLAWTHAVLTAEEGNALYVPAGFAHGFITLSDDCDVLYQMGDSYRPERAAGFRWNDPAFGIEWPCVPALVSERDASYPDYQRTP